jgi:iron(III) transport system ATP-binding protein
VSQHFELRNHYRMLELLEMASHVDPEQATRIYELCRIRHLLHRKNNQLSGGERQRVALALAVLKAPQLLLLDEPFSNMDAGHTQILKEVLNNLIQTLSTTMLLVSHDARDSLTWADEILVLQHGQIMQAGSPRHVYFKPVNEGIAGLFGAYNLVPTSAMDALQFLRMKEDSARQLFLRPEQLYLQAHGQANGVVLRTAFAGPYQEVHVSIAGSTLLAYTSADEQWQPGQPVAVQIRERKHWFL